VITAVGAKAAGFEYYFAAQEGPFDRMEPLQAAQVSYDYPHRLK
jgi:hypothetical protein